MSLGNTNGMKTAIDNAGRVVIPKALRDAAGLKAGVPLEIRLVTDHLEIEVAPIAVELKRQGGLLVAVPVETTPTLTHATVQKAADRIKGARGVTTKAEGPGHEDDR